MTPAEAIEKLESMQKQIIHGSNIFGEIADVMRDLDIEATFGRHWKENSSLEKWFPFSAEELATLQKKNARLTEACKLVLLFHSGSPWDIQKSLSWQNGMGQLLQSETGRVPDDFSDATTKNLCNAVRAALKEAT